MCYRMCSGLNVCVFGWQENSWSINFRGHSGLVGTIIVDINFRGV